MQPERKIIMQQENYYIGFRQTHPKPPGNWVLCGPFKTHEEATKYGSGINAWDSQVTSPFVAKSKEEAEERLPMFCGID